MMDYLIKVVLFALFVTVLYFVIDLFLNIIKPLIQTIPVTPILCKFGFFTGLNLFLSIIVAGFAVRQVLSFWK